ncbi:MAG: hypothetical protein HC809_03690 [Gammaproteobacteria bacterium]|nr:hypothetical protein [Gammaproteobacteria bacterium]
MRLLKCAIVVASLAIAQLAMAADAGTLVAAERIKWYPAWYLRAGIWFAELPGKLPVTNAVTLHRLTYLTRDWNDQLTEATGLVAIPLRTSARGIVSYQHGTTSLRREVPSKPSIDARLMAAGFGGAGYVLTAADYIGLGGSTAVHPYLHAQSAANACVDLLTAAEQFMKARAIPIPARLNLIGFSQGGHATAALQRALESAPRPRSLTAVATVAAPLNLFDVSFPYSLNGKGKSNSVYLAYMVRAYAEIYGQPIARVIAEPYASQLPMLFDGYHDNDAITAVLPRAPRQMFGADFLAAFDRGNLADTWLGRALLLNGVANWPPRAPLRLYFGTRDLDVSAEDSRLAATHMAALGGNATSIDVGAYDHEDSAFYAVPAIRQWFDELNPASE